MYKWILIRGMILNPHSDSKCDFIRNGVIVLKKVSTGHNIEEVGTEALLEKYANKRSLVVYDHSDSLIIPGLLDLHFHWVQKDVTAMPKDNLLTWLENFTWPTEAKFKDKKFCNSEAKDFTAELLRNGTLGGACYGSIHAHSVDVAFKHFKGDYFIGNVLMTMNSPEYLLQSKKQAKSIMDKLSAKYKKRYVVTPRFAPTTDEEVMTYGSRIQKKSKGFVQSHLCETENEIDWVLSIYKERKGFEDVKSYSDIYQRCGLLGEKTIMGHGVYLSKEDLQILKKTNTAIAHCPTSNAPVKDKGLGSGLFDFKLAEKNKIRWGLGSDIGAGPFVSMLDVMESFVQQNKKVKGATYTKALYRATLKNAEILGIDKSTGNFESGKNGNLVILKPMSFDKKLRTSEQILKVFFNSITRREEFKNQVEQVFYQGKSFL